MDTEAQAKLEARQDIAKRLIPTNGVFITETRYPQGWQVARYDHEGFTSEVRWFDLEVKAMAYQQSSMAKRNLG